MLNNLPGSVRFNLVHLNWAPQSAFFLLWRVNHIMSMVTLFKYHFGIYQNCYCYCYCSILNVDSDWMIALLTLKWSWESWPNLSSIPFSECLGLKKIGSKIASAGHNLTRSKVLESYSFQVCLKGMEVIKCNYFC